ncbi:MAG: MBOAT family protein [Mogibacterium sp.]|nr:MBOAT family protein [Mogibacterium sp.]
MSFTSFAFLIFVGVLVLIYYATPARYRWVVLLLASYGYYLQASAKSFAFILLTTVVTFYGALFIDKENSAQKAYLAENKATLSRDEKKAYKEAVAKRKKRILVLVLVIDFGILILLKYFRYYLDVLGIGLFKGDVLIPLGISFYTFQSTGYLIDVYRAKYGADKHLAKFALFVSFFPQIVQGPIARHDQLAAQLYEGHKFRYENLAHGAQLMLWGFFKKLVIADRIGLLVGEVFVDWDQYTGWPVVLAMLCYSIQLYMDFSGGVDIARGVAQTMGIDMTRNFRRPYFGDSLEEFWHRWHISLSFWTRDYIFFTVALSKPIGELGKKARKVFGDRIGKMVPVFIGNYLVFLCIGMWQGGELQNVAYGLYNATVICLADIMAPYFVSWKKALHIKDGSKGWHVFAMIRTYFIVSFGRLFSNGASMKASLHMIKSLFIPYKGGFMTAYKGFELTKYDYLVLAVAIAVVFVVSLKQEQLYNAKMAKKGAGGGIIEMAGDDEGAGTDAEMREYIDKKSMLIRWAIYLLLFSAVLILGVYGPGYDASVFIYREF